MANRKHRRRAQTQFRPTVVRRTRASILLGGERARRRTQDGATAGVDTGERAPTR